MKVRVITSSSYLDDAREQPLPPGVYTVQQRPGRPPHFRWVNGDRGERQGMASFRPVWASESFQALVVVLDPWWPSETLEHTEPASDHANRPDMEGSKNASRETIEAARMLNERIHRTLEAERKKLEGSPALSALIASDTQGLVPDPECEVCGATDELVVTSNQGIRCKRIHADVRMRRAARELRAFGPMVTVHDIWGVNLSTTGFVFVRDAARSLGFCITDEGGAILNCGRAGCLPDAVSYAIEALETLG